jgi:hypothetical protein
MTQADDRNRDQAPLSKKIEDLYQLIDGIEIAMFTTRRPDGHLVSRPMATQTQAEGTDLWFVTDIESNKLPRRDRERLGSATARSTGGGAGERRERELPAGRAGALDRTRLVDAVALVAPGGGTDEKYPSGYPEGMGHMHGRSPELVSGDRRRSDCSPPAFGRTLRRTDILQRLRNSPMTRRSQCRLMVGRCRKQICYGSAARSIRLDSALGASSRNDSLFLRSPSAALSDGIGSYERRSPCRRRFGFVLPSPTGAIII